MWVIFDMVFKGNEGGGCVSDYWHDFQGERRRGV